MSRRTQIHSQQIFSVVISTSPVAGPLLPILDSERGRGEVSYVTLTGRVGWPTSLYDFFTSTSHCCAPSRMNTRSQQGAF